MDARLQRHADHLAGLRSRSGTSGGGDTATAAGGATPPSAGAPRSVLSVAARRRRPTCQQCTADPSVHVSMLHVHPLHTVHEVTL